MMTTTVINDLTFDVCLTCLTNKRKKKLLTEKRTL